MARHVPIFEFIHELRAAGIRLDYDDLVRRPQEYWGTLPAGRRALLLARLHIDTPIEGSVHVQIVKRRAHSPAPENVFLRIHTDDSALLGLLASARDHVLYGEVDPRKRPGAGRAQSARAEPVTTVAFVRPGVRARPHAMALLDAAWGGPTYDPAREGEILSFQPPDDAEVIAHYEIEPSFSEVAALRVGNRLLYHIIEPELNELEVAFSASLNERLRDALVLDASSHEDPDAHLARLYVDLLRASPFRVDRRTAYRIGYYFLRNYVGFGRLEPLMRDPHIEDISCNGADLPVFVVHSTHQHMTTNLSFEDLELNSFTIKLAQLGGKLISVAQPLVDATLPDGSRIQATLGREVTSRGSAFTVRRFREDPLTAVDLIRSGSHTVETMAFLWLMVEMRRSLIVMGATASGKTTTLNCLSQFVPPMLKIVSIEDTREITLQHENWLAAVTRDAFTRSGAERITMYDLLRAALRQRPEYIIVGEIRGAEGVTLFQAMSTGHTCFSTMHAGSVENAVYRLENVPVSVPRVMLTSLDFFLLQGQVDVGGISQRRMLSLTEINGIDPASRNLRTNEVFRWNPETDTVAAANASHLLEEARVKRGWTRAALEEDLAHRRRVLEGLVERGERHYRRVGDAVAAFYANRVLPANAPVVHEVVVE